MRPSRIAVALFLALCSFPALAAITGTVMTADGQPVAGARVMIHTIETPAGRRERLLSPSPQLPALAETKTDAKGAFSLPSPEEPVVDLRVEMRGYEPETRRVEKDEELGAIAVTAREMRSGTITSGGGKPVANATVVIVYGQAEYVVRTDAQGKYEAPEPRRARSITVLHPDFAAEEEIFFMQPATVSELTRTLSTGVTLNGKVVAADGTTPVDKAVISVDNWPVATSAEDGSFIVAHAPSKWSSLTVRKETLTGHHAYVKNKPLTVRLERLGVISGRVFDAKSKIPVAGAMVRVSPNRRGQSFDMSPVVLTDAKGAFSILSPAGTFMVSATHPAFDMQSTDVTVTAGQPVSRDITLTQLARVSGVVVDEEERPVVAARVSSESTSGGPEMRMMMFRDPATAISGTDGRFSLRLRGDSDLRLRASKKGLPQAKSEALRFQPGERKSGMVLTIPSGVAVTGRVLDPSGNPLSGVSVTASETPVGERAMMMRRFSFRGMMQDEEDVVRTAGDGTFNLRLKEGTYDLTFQREGFAPKTVRAQNVAANGAQPIETRMDPAAEVSGRVTRGGVGVPDVSVSAFGETDATVVTGPDGSFTLGGLAAGPIRLSLRKEDGFINEMRPVTAPARDVNIELPVGGTIRGRVVEKGTRKPIAAFQAGVSPSRSGGGMMMMMPPLMKSFTTEDGSFTLENVPPGAMNIVATATGYAAARLNVSVEEGKALTDVALELEPGVRLTGKVTGPNGTPLTDAMVGVQPSPTGSFGLTGSLRRTTTDANGEYTLEGLEPGEETIQITHQKYNSTTRTVTLKGSETRLDVQLEGGTTVKGMVVTDSGMPVADAEVEAFSAASGGHSGRTNASGSFEIESVPPGRYRFTATKSGYVEAVQQDVDITSGPPIRLVLQTGGTIYGRVTGLAEADMANLTVTARSGRSSSAAPVDPQGNYRIEGAPTGTVSVSATLQSRSYSSRRTSGMQTVELAAGGTQQVNIDFNSDVVIRGRVTRNGVPLAGASVGFYPRSGSSRASASVTTDEQGMYAASGLEEGEYSVSVTDMQRSSPYNTSYTVRGSTTFDIDFKAGTVRGRVIDAGSNGPLENVTVQFRSRGTGTEMRGMRTAVTDATGSFTIDYVHPGSYTVTASRDGYGNATLETSFTDAGRDDLELRLSRSDGVVMTIVDYRDGRPLSGQVTVFDALGVQVYDTRANMRFGDAAKEIRLPLSPGSYTATVFVPEYAPRHITLTSPSTPRISISPGGKILVRSKHNTRRRMRLLDASGMGYPRWGAVPGSRELPPGTTTLENIAPGSYTLVLLNEDESTAARQTVVVREGETVPVDL